MKRTNVTPNLLKQVWHLTRSYWRSEEKKKAYLLLAAILLLTLGVVFMLVLLNEWNNAFYTALQDYQTEEIFHQLKRFTVLAFIYIILAVYAYYLQQVLILHWRRWLTGRYIDAWLQNKTYYRLQMFGKDMDNPDQRISEDVNLFVTDTLGFFVGIIKAVCTLLSFVVILWQLSGPFSFQLLGRTWQVPGYMVWVAVAYAVVGTWLTHRVGHKLVALNFLQQRREADFRFSMMRMRENAESVAFYHGEEQEGRVFKNRFTLLLENFWKIVLKQKQLVWLNSGYSQIAIIFPFVVAIPRFLRRELTLGGLMQVATAFGRVQDALSYFVDMYTSLAAWQAVVERLTSFEAHMELVQAAGSASQLVQGSSPDAALHIKDLEVDLPNGQPILQGLNLTLEPGKNLLIQGLSGSGKSTLLKLLLGNLQAEKGQIIFKDAAGQAFQPDSYSIGYLAQDLVLFPATLAENVTMHTPGLSANPKDYLETVGLQLDPQRQITPDDLTLSGGQKQKLALARTLSHGFPLLLLDESLSAVDRAGQDQILRTLCQLPATVIFVAHNLSPEQKARFDREISLAKREHV